MKQLNLEREYSRMTRLDGWSLSKDNWRKLTEVLANVEWGMTRLNKLYQGSVPRSAGIYLLITDSDNIAQQYKLPKGISTVLYVGRSDCLRDRFKQHAADSKNTTSQKNPLLNACSTTFGDLRYLFALVPEKAKGNSDNWLRLVENALITVFSPPVNRNVPRGLEIKARLGAPQPLK
ncbi:MAG: hypothetical protein OXF04_04050 [bacterium]|nr:hypothetical protein [bacterium]